VGARRGCSPGGLTLVRARTTIQAIQSARRQIGQNINARLALEVMLLETPLLSMP
jgi:hypothetical protein